MLQITIPYTELWDGINQTFIYVEPCELELEHSLLSISKWEAKYHKPFLTKEPKIIKETIDYIKCMCLSDVPDIVYRCLTENNIDEVNAYIDDPMTATRFSDNKNGSGGQTVITSEVVYYLMFALGIPIECQTWHLNRLITLIRVFEAKNQKPKKMSTKDILTRNAALNEARKKQLNTTG